MKTAKIGDKKIEWHDDGSVIIRQDNGYSVDVVKVKRDELDEFIEALDEQWRPMCTEPGCMKGSSIVCPNCKEDYCGAHYVAHGCTQPQQPATPFPILTPMSTWYEFKCGCGKTMTFNGRPCADTCSNCGVTFTVC